MKERGRFQLICRVCNRDQEVYAADYNSAIRVAGWGLNMHYREEGPTGISVPYCPDHTEDEAMSWYYAMLDRTLTGDVLGSLKF
jgi:hypothetical protein